MDLAGVKVENNDDSCSQEENKTQSGHCGVELGVGQAVSTPEQSPSVSVPPGKTSGAQLRTSARVSKKLRLDSISSASVPSSTSAEKKEVAVKEEAVEDASNARPKSRRPFEPWSVEGKDWFFEALNEYGKDYDAIRTHYAMRMRKRGLPEHLLKNKDQIRHFYYRTWSKISKYLKFSDDMSKVAQELYGLINYGELRKKIAGPFTEKMGMRLNELVFYGATQLRVRGKTVRVKTPICRSLRRLHLEEGADCPEDLRLPARISVELRPSDNMSWNYVHAAAQNPRVRTTLLLQRRLSSLISFLQQRWRPPQQRLRDEILGGDSTVKRPFLRIRPPPDAHISLPTVNAGEFVTSSSLSLQRYEERMLPPNSRGAPVPSVSTPTRGSKGGKGAKRVEVGEEVAPPAAPVVVATDEVLSTMPAPKTPESASSTAALPDATVDHAVEQILELSSRVAAEKAEAGVVAVKEEVSLEKRAAEVGDAAGGKRKGGGEEGSGGAASNNTKAKEEGGARREGGATSLSMADVRRGWTLEDAATLTIGELYLMIGGEGKIQLEYVWEEPAEEDEVANKVGILTSALQKLVSIAKLSLNKTELKCPCGHVCGRRGAGRGGGGSNVRGGARVNAAKKPLVHHIRVEPSPDKIGQFSPVGKSTEEQLLAQQQTPAWGAPPPPPPLNMQTRTLYRDGVFRRPPLAPCRPLASMVSPGAAAEAFKAQLDKFRPKYCNRRGRSVRKSVVVQRMLPLLPKAPTAPPHAFMTLKVIPQTSQLSGEFAPIAPSPTVFCAEPPLQQAPPPPPPSHDGSPPPPQPIILESSSPTTLSTVVPSSGGALDLPLAGPSFVGLLSGSNEDASSKERTVLSSSAELPSLPVLSEPGPCSSEETDACVTPPSSPSRILEETDGQWINSEVADFSLSSFLGHLDSPLKPSSTVAPAAADDSRLSSDVEAQLQCLMSENSVDYMAKFADLAAQIASDVSAKK
ncbi:LOW QUALITY PROTEIN: protein cramped-like [Ischnura elegans]|uniref:LOW QUALITY PROTEIN: protein cramped-like n=1 Tax=Ischnura elegans TaxID=197161 RepID=UPI001ED89809|nr:LOW QUALITY PROTEIN: protein cramped-like [Ischnura elegans]